MARFDDARASLAERTDAWIYRLEYLEATAAMLKERKDRAHEAQKAREAAHKAAKEYLKYLIESKPGVPFKGTEGSLALQRNPEAVKYAFTRDDKTFYATVHPHTLEMFPSLRSYVTTASVMFVDGAKVKADLRLGMQLDFATLETGSHVRVRS